MTFYYQKDYPSKIENSQVSLFINTVIIDHLL